MGSVAPKVKACTNKEIMPRCQNEYGLGVNVGVWKVQTVDILHVTTVITLQGKLAMLYTNGLGRIPFSLWFPEYFSEWDTCKVMNT